MACVIRDKTKRDGKLRSRFWYACFTDALGRRLKKSTGLTAKSKAMEMARTWEKASEEARQLRLTEARAREVISELMQSVGGESLTVFTVEQWFSHFVKGKKKSRSDSTVERHEQMMREFMEFLGPRAKLNIAAITSRDIAEFRDRRNRARVGSGDSECRCRDFVQRVQHRAAARSHHRESMFGD